MAGNAMDAWKHRSVLMKLFTVVQVLTILLHSFCLISKHWAIAIGPEGENQRKEKAPPNGIGLWDYIVNRHKVSLGPSHVIGAVLAVASLVLMAGACALNMLCLHRRLIAIMASLIALTFTSGVLLVATIVLWVSTHTDVQHLQLSWATYLASTVAVLHLVTCVIVIADLFRASRRGAPIYRMTQAPPDVEEEVDELL